MFTWSIVFLVIALVAAVFGYTGIAHGAVAISKTIFFISLGLLILSLGFNLVKLL
jgi:uncharacterized membrane protein YtjA (UPF0391 family)